MNEVLFGDCRESLEALAMLGVKAQTCVTSPPYFGLRDYKVEGQLGLEPTPEEYIANMVEVFRGVKEVLADDGTLWVNIGDSYAGSGKGRNADGSHQEGGKQGTNKGTIEGSLIKTFTPNCKSKDLIGIPWMLAFALRADGWYLRQDILWQKPNPMPESVKDRCTKSHEYIFLFSKSPKYYFDSEAIKEPAKWERWGNQTENKVHSGTAKFLGGKTVAELPIKDTKNKRDVWSSPDEDAFVAWLSGQENGEVLVEKYLSESAQKHSVWRVATKPYRGAHFAVFPPALIEPCILAGSRPGDTVIDPFMGSGTTAEVAQRLGRRWVGCELNRDYAPLIANRLAAIQPQK